MLKMINEIMWEQLYHVVYSSFSSIVVFYSKYNYVQQ